MRAALKKLENCLCICLILLFLGACAATRPAPVEELSADATLAQQALATGNFSEAAKLWQDAALESAGPESHQYRLQAAEAWMRAGENSRSEKMLNQVDENQLLNDQIPPDRIPRYSLLHAELALAAADSETAEVYLVAARETLTTNQQARYKKLLARVTRLQTDPASFALSTAASAMQSFTTYDSTRGVAILQLLEDVSSDSLTNISEYTADAYQLNDWPELTVLIRGTLVNNLNLKDAAESWSMSHPGHEVSADGFIELASRYRQLFSLPTNIAVLLPGKGGLTAAGKSIRDGLMSAYLIRPENVNLKFYATTEDPQSAVSAYFQAVGEGAQWIIGPLRRESVEALSELGSLGVPALALNSTSQSSDSRSADNLLFRLSLSQEEEARAVAARALENGHTRAILLSANNSWGSRMEAAFGDAFVSGGGVIATASKFSPLENDHSGLMTELLRIDDSNERRNRLQATLGVNLNFEPSRRDDFDFFFLAASPLQGRQIRPQLRFHDAGGKAVYAMGRIYSGAVDRTTDQDLNDVIFPTTQFQLSAMENGDSPEFSSLRSGNSAALHALGRDAWNLLPWLTLMRKDPDLTFQGSVGALNVRQDGQLLREPVWAQFSRGRPTAVTWPDSDSQ